MKSIRTAVFLTVITMLAQNASAVVWWHPEHAPCPYEQTLLGAVKNNQIEKVRELLADNVNPNSKDRNNDTALHWATYYGYKDIAIALIDANANLEATNNVGNTPLLEMFRFDHQLSQDQINLCYILVTQYNASTTVRNHDGLMAHEMTSNPAVKQFLEFWAQLQSPQTKTLDVRQKDMQQEDVEQIQTALPEIAVFA